MTHRLWTRRLLQACIANMLLLAATAFAPGCKNRQIKVGDTHEETRGTMSVLNMGDPSAEPQLVKGLHGIEGGAWRWTAKDFTVALRPPFGADQKGTNLIVKVSVPPVVIEKEKTVSLSATVAGSTALPPETYYAAGEYFYIREVQSSLLGGDSLRVDFHLDKAMAPSSADLRELGIIVVSIGLELKK
jgi:hypothetical protein